MEVGKLRKRIADFDKKQSEFRDNFKKIRFFKFGCRRPYHYLQMSNDMIDQMEADMKTLQVSNICNQFLQFFDHAGKHLNDK